MTEPVSPVKTPEWLLLLEKKKNRPHRLAHEIGAGAPCLVCEEKCPGLDLHFWRKLCRNCKCKKEDHDVKDDDGYEQFEILLGAGNKRKKPGAILKIKVPEIGNDTVISSNTNVPFDWVPPNVSEDVAAEYMGQLPAAKLPISGSDGALYRKQQLERQMPLHDLDASRCHNLTPEEIEELQKYLDNLKNNVVGQGRVTKVPTLYTEQRHCYRGPTIELNISCQVPLLPSSRSEQSFQTLPPFPRALNTAPRPFISQASNNDLPPPLPTTLPPDDTASNLKIPGYFFKNIPSCDNRSGTFSECPLDYSVVSKDDSSESQYDIKYQSVDGQTLSSQFPHNAVDSTSVCGKLTSELSQLCLNRDHSQVYFQGKQSTGKFSAEGPLSSVNYLSNIVHSSTIPGQIAPSMSCPLKVHENSLEYSQGSSMLTIVPGHLQEAARVPILEDSSIVLPQDGSTMHFHNPQNIAYSTVAPGMVAPGTSTYQQGRTPLPMYSQDGSKFVAGQVQNIGTDGSTLHSQNPQNVAYSTAVPGQMTPEKSLLQQNRGALPINSLDGSTLSQYPRDLPHSPGISLDQNSQGFSQPQYIINGQLSQEGPVASSKDALGVIDSSKFPDPASNRLLAGNGNLNSPIESQHPNEKWSENNQMPVPSRFEYTFQPQYDVSVSTDIRGDSMPRSAHVMQQSHPVDLTISSQLNLSAQEQKVKSHLSCQHCSEPLAAGDVAVFADRAGDNSAWHPNCFVCKTCDELLVDLIYFFNKGNVYCGRHFAELLNIPRCYACDELIFVKEYTVAEGRTFHVKHFCCYECDSPLAGKQYVPLDDQPTCLDCYQVIFGKRCNTCKKQIAAGERRIGWKELNWHAVEECFCCHGCGKSLLGGKFVMRDEKPFCNKECVELSTTGK